MKAYLISYDLVAPGRNYQRLFEELNRLGGFRVLQSQWVIRVTNTAAQVRDHLMQFVDANDRVLVNDFFDWAGYNLLTKLEKAA